MKKIDYKFMGMGLVFLFFGLLLHRFLIFIAGLALSFTAFSAEAWLQPRKISLSQNWPKERKNKENRYAKLYP